MATSADRVNKKMGREGEGRGGEERAGEEQSDVFLNTAMWRIDVIDTRVYAGKLRRSVFLKQSR